MLCWTSGFFVGFYNLFIFVYKLFRIVLYNVYKEQIEYNQYLYKISKKYKSMSFQRFIYFITFAPQNTNKQQIRLCQ